MRESAGQIGDLNTATQSKLKIVLGALSESHIYGGIINDFLTPSIAHEWPHREGGGERESVAI
jgi:hypothetical protein